MKTFHPQTVVSARPCATRRHRAALLAGASVVALLVVPLVPAAAFELGSATSSQVIDNRGADDSSVKVPTGTIIKLEGVGRDVPAVDGRTRSWTIDNDGTISSDGIGIFINQGSILNNRNGQIDGSYGGIVFENGGTLSTNVGGHVNSDRRVGVSFLKGWGQVTNSCNIYGRTAAISLGAGGFVTNQGGAYIQTPGTGVLGQGSAVTVVNRGNIVGTDYRAGSPRTGISLEAGGLVINRGLVRGRIVAVSLKNGGTVDNSTGGRIVEDAGEAGALALLMEGGARAEVINHGTISSTHGDAVVFRNITEGVSLTLGTGSVISGAVKVESTGGTAAPTTSALVLRGAGTQNLGNFTGFRTATIESTAAWNLSGTAVVPAFTNNGILTPGKSDAPETFRITGNFVQTSGGVLRIGLLQDLSMGKLEVSGTAALAGGVRLVGPANLRDSFEGVILSAGGGTSGVFDSTVVHNLAYVTPTLVYAQDSKSVTLRFATNEGASTAAATPDPQPAAEIVQSISATPNPVAGPAPGATVPGSSSASLATGAAYADGSGVDTRTIRYASVARTPTQAAVGNALTGLAAGGALDDFLNDLAGQTVEGARSTLAQVAGGGEAQTNQIAATASLGRALTGTFMKPVSGGAPGRASLAEAPSLARIQFADASPLPNSGAGAASDASQPAARFSDLQGVGAWASGFGAFGSIGGDGNGGAADFTSGGGAFGVDKRLTPDLTLGLALGYARADSSQDSASSEASTDSTSLALYGGWRAGKTYVSGTLGYAYNAVETTRNLNLPTSTPTLAEARGRTHGNQIMAEVEAGHDLQAGGGAIVTPFIGLQTTVLWQSGYTEDGAGVLNMAMGATRTPSLRTVLGADMRRSFDLGPKAGLDLTARLGWAHELRQGSPAVDLAFAAQPVAAFRLDGVRRQRDSALIGLGLGTALSEGLSGFLRYDGDLGRKDQTSTISAGLRLGW